MLSSQIYKAIADNYFFDKIPIMTKIPSKFEDLNFEKFIIIDSLDSSLEKNDTNYVFLGKEQDFTLQVFQKNESGFKTFVNQVIEVLIGLYYLGYSLSLTSIYGLPSEVFGGYNVKGINFTVSKF